MPRTKAVIDSSTANYYATMAIDYENLQKEMSLKIEKPGGLKALWLTVKPYAIGTAFGIVIAKLAGL